MKLMSEYLERCQQFARLAAAERNAAAKQQLQDQANAYYKLAAKRARELKLPIPPKPPALTERA
jgi:uncharacterized alpha-E superfamily protein